MNTELNSVQNGWCTRAQFKHRQTREYFRDMLRYQNCRCAFSDVKMLYSPEFGTAAEGGRGCHALYATVDHTIPGRDSDIHVVVCYALKDIKVHLPIDCFEALQKTLAWKNFMQRWRDQAKRDATDSIAFYRLRYG